MPLNGRFRQCVLIGLACAAAGAPPPASRASDAQLLDGLRQRQLFALAETWCRRQLERSDLDARRRAELVTELSRTYVEHALGTRPEQREPLWRQARQTVDDYLARHADDPWAGLARVQLGLVHLAHGELLRQEAELVAGGDDRFGPARAELRAAVGALRDAAAKVEQQLREVQLAPRRRDQEVTAAELVSLERNVRYQLARAHRNQGQSYPHGSADRVSAVQQALELLGPLSELDPSDALAWPARIDALVCYRLLDDAAAAVRAAAQLEQASPPPAIALRARAELLRLALGRGKLAEARAALEMGRTLGGESSAELDLALIEVCMTLWREAKAASRTEEAGQWQSQAAALAGEMEQRYGAYWSRRAETLVAGSVLAAGGRGSLDEIRRAAEALYRAGRADEAVAAYERLQREALSAGQDGAAVDAALAAAAIEQQRSRLAEAARRLHAVALAAPQQGRAPAVHLTAVQLMAQAAGEAGQASDEYSGLLEEHLRMWPQGPTASRAWLALGRLRQHQRRWREAIDAYRGVSPEDAQYLEALEAAAACFDAQLNAARQAGDPIGEQAAAAARFYEGVITGGGGRLPDRWQGVEQFAALAAARYWLLDGDKHYARVESILTSALGGSADATREWTSAAYAWLVFALAGQGRLDDASRAMDQVAAGGLEPLVELVEGLGRIAPAVPEEKRRSLAELRLRAAAMVEPQRAQLAPAERRRFDLARAAALADAGRFDRARQVLEDLAADWPGDGQVQEALAAAMSAATDGTALEAALAQWREVERKSRPGSDRWFRARYAVAELYERMGRGEQAVKLIELMRVLYPAMGGPELKGQFDAVYERCRGQVRGTGRR